MARRTRCRTRRRSRRRGAGAAAACRTANAAREIGRARGAPDRADRSSSFRRSRSGAVARSRRPSPAAAAAIRWGRVRARTRPHRIAAAAAGLGRRERATAPDRDRRKLDERSARSGAPRARPISLAAFAVRQAAAAPAPRRRERRRVRHRVLRAIGGPGAGRRVRSRDARAAHGARRVAQHHDRRHPAAAAAANRLGSTSVDVVGGWLVGQPFTIEAGATVYPSFAAATASAFLGVPVRAQDAWSARIGETPIPLDGNRLLLMLPFANGETVSALGTLQPHASFFQSISFVDAVKLDDASMASFARGKIVVIGATAAALGDYVATPHGRAPGVFGHLRMIDQLVRKRFIARAPPALDLVLIVLLPLLIGFAVTQLRPAAGVAIGIAVVLVYSIAVVAIYGHTLVWLNLIHVDGATILAALFVALYRTATEGADKRMIREMFGKHVSPALVDEMMAHDDPLKALDLSGKRVKVTVFYSDIRGFTAMSETMTPEEIYGALNEYFEEMCRLVFEHGGYVDKFIGDCVMAVFSAPKPRPNDAYEAVLSAWRQQQRIDEMMVEWAANGRKVFTVGMGLNTGEVVMGNLGSADRLNYTVIGDNVNTAARLYNVAKGGQIIISEPTYEEVKDHFIVNELTPVFVKGKVLALRNFEIVGLLKPGESNPSTLFDPANLPAPFTADAH